MSACSPNCPVVRKQLREIVKGAPWITEKEIPENEESLITPADAVVKKRPPYPDYREERESVIKGSILKKEIPENDESLITPTDGVVKKRPPYPDYKEERESVIKGSILKKEAPEDEELFDAPLGSATKNRLDAEHQNLVQSKTKSTVTQRGEIEVKISVTRRSSSDAEGKGIADVTGIEKRTNVDGESIGRSGARYSQTSKGVSVMNSKTDLKMDSKMDSKTDSKMDTESAKTTGSRGLGASSNVPTTSGASDRRTISPGGSREIGQDQNINKGRVGESDDFNFIDEMDGGICTCTAHCIFRALRNNPFARSILMSTLLFALGLKLCSELEGWSMPIQS